MISVGRPFAEIYLLQESRDRVAETYPLSDDKVRARSVPIRRIQHSVVRYRDCGVIEVERPLLRALIPYDLRPVIPNYALLFCSEYAVQNMRLAPPVPSGKRSGARSSRSFS